MSNPLYDQYGSQQSQLQPKMPFNYHDGMSFNEFASQFNNGVDAESIAKQIIPEWQLKTLSQIANGMIKRR